jgi:hypothetical protein
MALLAEIRSLFTRRKPTVIDLAPPASERRFESHSASSNGGSISATEAAETPYAESIAPSSSMDAAQSPVERKLNGAPDHPDQSRAIRHRSFSDSRPPTVEIISAIGRIGDHLDSHAEQNARLMDLLEKLPKSLDSLPEVNRQTSRLLEVVGDQLETTRKREEGLLNTLSRINDTARDHSELLGQIGGQLETNHQTSANLGESINSLRHALTDLAESNSRTVGALSHLTKANQARDMDLLNMVRRMQWWLVTAVILCGLMAAAAVAFTMIFNQTR